MLPITEYILAIRPWSLPASLIPTLFGNVMAYKHLSDGTFNFLVAFGTMVCVFGVHISGNLFNTYYDFVNGIDGPNSNDRTLVDGNLKPHVILNLGLLAYMLSCAVGLIFLVFTNIDAKFFLVLFSIGALLSFLYTGGFQLKYWGLGDVVIILTFGPTAILFTYTAQTNALSWEPVMASFPLICFTEAILHANNTRDLREDEKKKILTLAIFLGDVKSRIIYVLLICFPFIYTFYIGVTHSLLFLLPFILLPMVLSLVRKVFAMDFDQLPQNTAELNLMYGVLYLFAYWYS